MSMGSGDRDQCSANQFWATMSKRRKRRGHFCWSCERVLPNERFSGRGHARHVCRQCQKLGKEELAYRSARRDIE